MTFSAIEYPNEKRLGFENDFLKLYRKSVGVEKEEGKGGVETHTRCRLGYNLGKLSELVD